MKRIISLTIALIMCAVAFCSSSSGQKLYFGKEYAPVDSQLDVLIQLNAKSVDVGVMDSIMAKYYTSQDSSYASSVMIIPDLTLKTEQYGIAARKGSALIYHINNDLLSFQRKESLQNLQISSVLQTISALMKIILHRSLPILPTGIISSKTAR